MDQSPLDRPALRLVLTLAAFVIIVAGLRAASTLVVPFLLAVFIAILTGPLLQWLHNRGLPKWLAMLIVLVALCVVGFLLAGVIVTNINRFAGAWEDVYQPRAETLTRDVISGWNGGLERKREDWGDWIASLKLQGSLTEWISPDFLMQSFSQVLLAASSILSQAALILITTIFLLMEAAILPAKVRLIAADPEARIHALERIAHQVNRYMALKTGTSLLTGVLIATSLWLMNVDVPVLWGLIAFLLNYVPNIGSIIAAVPAVLLTVLQLGVGEALAVVAIYTVVNISIGNFLEPRVMGRGLGLSTLVVFISLVFWGWVLGPVGMVISVPLTMTTKIALESSDDTRWLAVLMGPSPSESSPNSGGGG